MDKKDIIDRINFILDSKIASLQKSIESAKESRDSETKSSVGDKYETGRAMMQYELEKHQNQLGIVKTQKQVLTKINTQQKSGMVEQGSLVFTSFGIYFIALGLGNILVNNENIMCISLASPVGKLLSRKSVGDTIHWQGKKISIRQVM